MQSSVACSAAARGVIAASDNRDTYAGGPNMQQREINRQKMAENTCLKQVSVACAAAEPIHANCNASVVRIYESANQC